MLPLQLLRIRGFAAGNGAVFLLNAALTGVIFFTAQFLQVSLKLDPLGAGLRLLPWGVAPLLLAPRAGRLADRVGERPLVSSGLVLLAAGFAWIAGIAGPGTPYWALLGAMVISGAGLALAIPAVTRAVVGSVPPTAIGKATGAFSAMRQLGGAFGIAILAAVFAGAGSYASPAAFSAGYGAAVGAAAGLALAGAVVALALPARTTAAQASGRPAAETPGDTARTASTAQGSAPAAIAMAAAGTSAAEVNRAEALGPEQVPL
jgi:MFS family permease